MAAEATIGIGLFKGLHSAVSQQTGANGSARVGWAG